MAARWITWTVLVLGTVYTSGTGLADDTRIQKLRIKRDQTCAGLHVRLALWCQKEGLHAEARRHFLAALRYNRWNVKTRAACEGELAPDAPKIPKSSPATLKRKEQTLAKGLAKLWSRHALQIGRAGKPDEAPWAWARALAAQPESRSLRKRLGEEADRHLRFVHMADRISIDDSKMSATGRGSESARWADTIFRDRLPMALARVEKRIGLTLKAEESVAVFLTDTGSPTSRQLATANSNSRDDNYLEIHTNGWTSQKDLLEMESVVDHELVHILAIHRMGATGYRTLPKWFREGIAVYGARQGPVKLQWALEKTGGRIDTLLDGLEPGLTTQQNPEDYAESWMALRFLEQRLNKEGFRAFLDRLHAREGSLEELIAELTGLQAAAFEKSAHDYARNEFRTLLGER